MAEQQLEQIEGTVEDIIYENTDNGYMVFEDRKSTRLKSSHT